jgi:hypothetical protein
MAARPSPFAARLLALTAGLCLALAGTARAQVVSLAEPIPVTDDLAVVLEQGARLESERRWAEALSH